MIQESGQRTSGLHQDTFSHQISHKPGKSHGRVSQSLNIFSGVGLNRGYRFDLIV